ncbi:MAG TPA: DUF4097 family beta strand repeat-containing protein [Bacillales bacterium]
MRKILGILFIIVGISVLVTLIGNKSVSSWYSSDTPHNQSAILRNVDKIEIDADATNINLIPEEDRHKLMVDLHGGGSENVDLNVHRAGHELEISVDHSWCEWFSFGEEMILDVYVPGNYNQNIAVDLGSGNLNFHGASKKDPMVLNKLEVDMSSGNADLQYLQLHQIVYDGSSGNFEAEWLTVKKSLFDISSGNIELAHYTGALDAELSSGKFKAQIERLRGPIDIEASSGIISLDLPDEADFTYQGNVSSGMIRNDYPLQNKRVDEENVVKGSHGTGEYPVNLEVSSGIINLY